LRRMARRQTMNATIIPLDAAPRNRLLARIRAFRFDEPGTQCPFVARLARENRWTIPPASRVIEEYPSFLFLAAAAAHPVTPSDQCAHAWHLHLLDSRSYWDRLCPEVLGRRLHHQPSRGGPAERAKFGAWYERTLESYRRLLGRAPP